MIETKRKMLALNITSDGRLRYALLKLPSYLRAATNKPARSIIE